MLVLRIIFRFINFNKYVQKHYYPMMVDAQEMPQKIKIAILTTV